MAFLDNFRDKGKKGIGFLLIPVSIFAADKQQHLARGMFWSISYFLLRHEAGVANWQAILISFLVVFSVALGMELYQKNKPNRQFSWYDITAEVLGWFVLVIIGGNVFYNLF